MSKLIGCQCSEAQLHHVGCECIEMIVEVWPKGYAHESGLKQLRVAHTTDVAAEVRKAFGYSASVVSKREANPVRKAETFSEEYIKEMSQGG